MDMVPLDNSTENERNYRALFNRLVNDGPTEYSKVKKQLRTHLMVLGVTMIMTVLYVIFIVIQYGFM